MGFGLFDDSAPPSAPSDPPAEAGGGEDHEGDSTMPEKTDDMEEGGSDGEENSAPEPMT